MGLVCINGWLSLFLLHTKQNLLSLNVVIAEFARSKGFNCSVSVQLVRTYSQLNREPGIVSQHYHGNEAGQCLQKLQQTLPRTLNVSEKDE